MIPNETRQANRRTIKWLVGLIGAMFVFAFAQVQLYGLFCQALGVDSLSARTPVSQEYLIDQSLSKQDIAATRLVTVRFDATVNAGLPWSFLPVEKKIKLVPGEYQQVTYLVKNLSNETIIGQSIPNVIPWQAQTYLKKIDCFCYNQQTLMAYEEKEMTVVFTLSPDLPEDMNSLVLSYTFLNTGKKSAQKYQLLNQEAKAM